MLKIENNTWWLYLICIGLSGTIIANTIQDNLTLEPREHTQIALVEIDKDILAVDNDDFYQLYDDQVTEPLEQTSVSYVREKLRSFGIILFLKYIAAQDYLQTRYAKTKHALYNFLVHLHL